MKCSYSALLLCLFASQARAEIVFPGDVQLAGAARRSDGVTYVVGQKTGGAYLARVADGPPVELPLQAPESSRFAAVAVDSGGAIYVAGTGLAGQRPFAFAQKYDEHGVQQYSVRIGGEANTAPRSIVVNAKGEALINGQVAGDGFPSTTGAPGASGATTGFVVKLDASGNVTVAVRGVGVGAAAYDPEDNIYVAGVLAGLPATPRAFQPEHVRQGCGGETVGFPCFYQQVVKLNPNGTRVLYSTFVTGTFGAVPAAIVVNDRGEAIVSGTTNSPDYPTTAGGLLPVYRARSSRRPGPASRPVTIPPAPSGYVTQLQADGSGLVWSTYFSGTGADSISDMVVLSDGRIAIAGQTASRDLPGLSNVPKGCAPLVGRELPFISILSGDSSRLLSTIVAWELAARGGPRLAEGTRGSLNGIGSRQFVQYSPGTEQQAACLADPADWTLLSEVAPGQLITIFGNGLDSAAVHFNGSAVRILYSSSKQINIQAPLDLTPNEDVTIQIASADRTVEQHVRAVERAPSVFMAQTPFDVVNPGVLCSGRGATPAYEPVALNEDGSLNTCGNGAQPGSTVVLFLNGLGARSPDVRNANVGEGEIESLESNPVNLMWRLRIRLIDNSWAAFVAPVIDGVKPRFTPLAVWMSQ